MKLKREETWLLLIDFQERLTPAMEKKEALMEAAVKLTAGCRILGVPVLLTQQYTKGLGATVPGLQEALGAGGPAEADEYKPIEKTSFSCMGEPVFAEALAAAKVEGCRSVLVAGIEAHVCVEQTVLDLLEEGFAVFVAADCVSSRKKQDRKYSLRRMEQAGAVITSCEAALFELLKGAKEPGFKEISNLVK